MPTEMGTPGWSSAQLTTLAADPRIVARTRNLRAGGAIALVVLGLLLFWPTTASLIEQWEDTVRRTYTHGYLIVAISLWLLWRNRTTWSHVELRPSVLAGAAVVGASIVWLIAYRAGVRIAHQALLPAMIFGAFAAGFGFEAARRNWRPFAFLYFAVPLWDVLNPLLQSASTFAVRMLLRTAGIPAFFSGNTFTLPAGSLEIAGGCSGLHFFIVGIAVATLYGELNRDSLRTRIRLVLLAVVLAMLTNWLRIFIIAVAAHVTDMQHHLVSEEHYTFGWGMFAGSMLIFFLIVRRWPVSPEAPVTVEPPLMGGAISWRGVALSVVSLLVAPAWLVADHNTTAQEQLPRLLPAAIDGWSPESTTREAWQPVFAGADVTERAAYSKGSSRVESYAALYANQHQGKELVGFNNSVTGATLSIRRRAASAGLAHWMELEASDSRGERWLLWYAYRLDDQWHDRTLPMQIQYGVRSLISAPVSSVVAIRAACNGRGDGSDCSAARDTLREFAEHLAGR